MTVSMAQAGVCSGCAMPCAHVRIHTHTTCTLASYARGRGTNEIQELSASELVIG